MYAMPAELVAVITRPPAALAPMQALIAECSDSTVTNSVSTWPLATKVEKSSTTCVDGVMGNAATTSGLIWRMACAQAPAPVMGTILGFPDETCVISNLVADKFECHGLAFLVDRAFTDAKAAALAVEIFDLFDELAGRAGGVGAVFELDRILGAIL